MVNKNIEKYRVLGLMSGTSMDGLDMALCSFSYCAGKWEFVIEKAQTIEYNKEIELLLSETWKQSVEHFTQADHQYGKWIAQQCSDFLKGSPPPLLISSHGHTLLHQPSFGYSLQIGNGNDIAAITGLPVVYDFRSMDVACGGQGAPLVPAGDELLFSEFDACLNLGGFSNISFKKDRLRIAYDICPVNMALNDICGLVNVPFDMDGHIGRKGELIPNLIRDLNNLEFYKSSPPKSLGREWYEKEFKLKLDRSKKPQDLLRSLYEHISSQISETINRSASRNVLLSGGGAKNKFLIELLEEKCTVPLLIPDKTLIDFKEALIFAFLGLLRYRNETNCLSSVTGARKNSIGGVMVIP
jgi:anhydro-N-acetylmuramic acid kinase